jgi:hypothetical protein
MDLERTQVQSPADRVKSQDLSLRKTQPPAKVPGYDPERLLGEGAYGEVWVATERNTGRKVAVKFYTHRGGLDWSLLKREVEKLAFLSADRYVIQLIEVGWDSDPPYYVMEYLGHGSLEERLNEQGALPPDEAIGLFREVATGLMHAHGKGVLHCDLKPANVLLDQDSRPRLCDFGQARLSDEQTPSLGTLFYMAPEQANLKQAVPDARWDVYALGALFYCMLTGEPPYRTDENVKRLESSGTLEERLTAYRQTIENAPKPMEHRKVPGVNRFLADIIDRCLAPQPARRYSNVQALLNDLDEWKRRKARRPILILGTVIPLVLLVLMAVFGWKAFDSAMTASVQALTKRTNELHELAATYAAPAVAAKIHTRWGALSGAADELGTAGAGKAEGEKPSDKAAGEKAAGPGKPGEKPSGAPPKDLPPAENGAKSAPARSLDPATVAFIADARKGLLQVSPAASMAEPGAYPTPQQELADLKRALDGAKQSLLRSYRDDPDRVAKIEAELNTQQGFERIMAYAETLPSSEERERVQKLILHWTKLQDWVKKVRGQLQGQGLSSTSVFVTNDQGDQLARDPLDIDTLFKNYRTRDYFHGRGRDLTADEARDAEPIKAPHLSHVFKSQATHQPMVVFSVPLDVHTESGDRVTAGVLGMGVEFGEFSELQHENEAIITSLIDAREDNREAFGGRRGGLLEHPLLRRFREEHRPLNRRFYVNDEIGHEIKLLAQPDDGSPASDAQLGAKKVLDNYEDPVSRPDDDGTLDEGCREYEGRWMAAMKPVVVNRRQTGWVVVVQERESAALAPANDLRAELGRQAVVAAIVVVLTLAAIWGFAWLTMQGHTRSKFVNALRRRVGLTGGRGTTSSTTPGTTRTARRPGKTPTSRSAGR